MACVFGNPSSQATISHLIIVRKQQKQSPCSRADAVRRTALVASYHSHYEAKSSRRLPKSALGYQNAASTESTFNRQIGSMLHAFSARCSDLLSCRIAALAGMAQPQRFTGRRVAARVWSDERPLTPIDALMYGNRRLRTLSLRPLTREIQ
jgi:hypothetical protein